MAAHLICSFTGYVPVLPICCFQGSYPFLRGNRMQSRGCAPHDIHMLSHIWFDIPRCFPTRILYHSETFFNKIPYFCFNIFIYEPFSRCLHRKTVQNFSELTGHFVRISPRLQTQRGRPPRPPSLCLLGYIGVFSVSPDVYGYAPRHLNGQLLRVLRLMFHLDLLPGICSSYLVFLPWELTPPP